MERISTSQLSMLERGEALTRKQGLRGDALLQAWAAAEAAPAALRGQVMLNVASLAWRGAHTRRKDGSLARDGMLLAEALAQIYEHGITEFVVREADGTLGIRSAAEELAKLAPPPSEAFGQDNQPEAAESPQNGSLSAETGVSGANPGGMPAEEPVSGALDPIQDETRAEEPASESSHLPEWAEAFGHAAGTVVDRLGDVWRAIEAEAGTWWREEASNAGHAMAGWLFILREAGKSVVAWIQTAANLEPVAEWGSFEGYANAIADARAEAAQPPLAVVPEWAESEAFDAADVGMSPSAPGERYFYGEDGTLWRVPEEGESEIYQCWADEHERIWQHTDGPGILERIEETDAGPFLLRYDSQQDILTAIDLDGNAQAFRREDWEVLAAEQTPITGLNAVPLQQALSAPRAPATPRAASVAGIDNERTLHR